MCIADTAARKWIWTIEKIGRDNMNQYKTITAWKCMACGRTLITQKGIERHKEKCKFIIPELDGQLKLTDDGGVIECTANAEQN